MKTKIDPKIFKAYDIRGIYPDEINEGMAKQIAKAFAKFLDVKTVVVGYDMRDSSKSIHEAFIDGLVEIGVAVYDIGLSSTPMLYWAISFLRVDGGVTLTASHNPIEYGGIKFVDGKEVPIFIENGLKEIAKLAQSDIKISETRGEIKKSDIKEDYIKFLRNGGLRFKNFKVVIDAMHGAMGPIVSKVFEGSGLDLTYLSCDSDGKIPRYKTPNPTLTENQTKIKEAIKSKGADLGLMWDGDGDRLVVLDSRGDFVSPSFVAAIITEGILQKGKGAIVTDVRMSKAVSNIAKNLGGKIIRAKSGNPFIKIAMRENDALFGAETSGHYMFKESNCAEDSVRAVISLLKYMSYENKSPQEIFDDLKSKYFVAQEMNFATDDGNILEKVSNQYDSGNIDRIDGLTIEFPDFWFNIRKSNTEPLIRLNMEANSAEILEQKKKELTDFLLENGCELSDH